MTKKQKILLGVSIAVLVGGAVLVYFLRKKKPQTKDIKKILVAEPNVKDTNAYKILERELNNAKDILEGYEKDGKVLLDTAKGLKSSEDGTKSVFFMITKQMPSIQKGIQNDVNLNDAQKKELINIVKAENINPVSDADLHSGDGWLHPLYPSRKSFELVLNDLNR